MSLKKSIDSLRSLLKTTTIGYMTESRESRLAGCEREIQILREASSSCVCLIGWLEDMTTGMDCRSADLMTEILASARYQVETCQPAVTGIP